VALVQANPLEDESLERPKRQLLGGLLQGLLGGNQHHGNYGKFI